MDCQPHLLPMKRTAEECASGTERVLTPTFPNRDVKLLDLPSHVLGRIAALASGAKSKPMEPILDFQVTFNHESWRNLNSLRACCRQLRDASRLAVGGLAGLIVGGKEVEDIEDMPLETAISISWSLVELNDVTGDGTMDLLNHTNKLAEVTVSGEFSFISDGCEQLASLNYDTLRIVRLHKVDYESAKTLVSSLKEGLKRIEYGHSKSALPLLSEGAKSTVEDVRLSCCTNMDDLFIFLSTAPILRKLRVVFCRFKDQTSARAIRHCSKLYEFVYDDEWAHACFEEPIATTGLASLQALDYVVEYGGGYDVTRRMLMSLKQQLRKLKLRFRFGLEESYFEPLSGVEFHPDCAVAVEVNEDSKEGLEHVMSTDYTSILPVLMLASLQSLKLDDLVHPLENVIDLLQLPKLNKLVIFCCTVNPFEVAALAQWSKSLTEVSLEHCSFLTEGRENRQRITTIAGYSVVSIEDLKTGNMQWRSRHYLR